MNVQIDPRKVAGVVLECNHALKDKGLNSGEVIVGVAELLARIIVETGAHQIQMDELKKVAINHIETAVRIGAFASGKSNIIKG
jgi:hypothetical protein